MDYGSESIYKFQFEVACPGTVLGTVPGSKCRLSKVDLIQFKMNG